MMSSMDAWDINEGDFPHNGSPADKLEFCVRYAVLASSTYNTQPWYFAIDQDSVSLYADRRHALPVIDPDDRQMLLACGGALYNLRLAIRAFGYEETTQLLPNVGEEDLIARIQIGAKKTIARESEQTLFSSITKRQMNHGSFQTKKVPATLLDKLSKAAEDERAWLYVCNEYERDIVASLIAEGDHIQMNDKHFRRELASWANPRRALSRDGMPNHARSYSEIMKHNKPRILRRFEMAPGEVVTDDQILAGCPVIAIIGSNKGGKAERLYAGQAIARILLLAEAEGLSVSPLNQPCEVPDLRLRLHDEIEHHHGRAHTILRIGYGQTPVNYSPRRPLSEVVQNVADAQPGFIPANDSHGASERPGFLGAIKKLFS